MDWENYKKSHQREWDRAQLAIGIANIGTIALLFAVLIAVALS